MLLKLVPLCAARLSRVRARLFVRLKVQMMIDTLMRIARYAPESAESLSPPQSRKEFLIIKFWPQNIPWSSVKILKQCHASVRKHLIGPIRVARAAWNLGIIHQNITPRQIVHKPSRSLLGFQVGNEVRAVSRIGNTLKQHRSPGGKAFRLRQKRIELFFSPCSGKGR